MRTWWTKDLRVEPRRGVSEAPPKVEQELREVRDRQSADLESLLDGLRLGPLGKAEDWLWSNLTHC